MENNLHILIGCPGSGKTTFALSHYDTKKEAYISRDDIRFSMVAENEPYFSKETEVYQEFIYQIINALENGFEVYADATHLTKQSRYNLIHQLESTKLITGMDAIWMNAPLELCLERNAKRTGRKFVPEEEVKKMYKRLQRPEFEEGFNTIYIVEENKSLMRILREGEDNYGENDMSNK